MAHSMLRTIGGAAILAGAAFLGTTPAAAQATRTWVSGVGDDANPCSRTAPCRTFAGAITKTAAGGEINCLDSGGFGAVTITKALSIICEGVVAGMLVSGTNGIVVNAGANDVVVLSGLDIEGAGTGLNGIRVMAARSVQVFDTIISGFNATSAGNGNGILFAPSGAAELSVVNTRIVDTGVANSGSGIEVAPAAGGSARVNIRSVYLLDNGSNGIRLNTSGTTAAAGIVASIDDSEISGSATGVSVFTPAGTTSAAAMIANSTVSNNASFGIIGFGTGATARVGLTTITGNGTGLLSSSGANLLSYGNNRLNGNGTDGTFTGTIAPQ
jgi:hypothetical protein